MGALKHCTRQPVTVFYLWRFENLTTEQRRYIWDIFSHRVRHCTAVCIKGPRCKVSSAVTFIPLHWRHNERDSVSNHQPHDWLLNRLFRRRSKKTSKLRATSLCAGNSPGTGEFPAQMASNAENVSIWWRHHLNSQQYPGTCRQLFYMDHTIYFAKKTHELNY